MALLEEAFVIQVTQNPEIVRNQALPMVSDDDATKMALGATAQLR
jgi:hypothetical protein